MDFGVLYFVLLVWAGLTYLVGHSFIKAFFDRKEELLKRMLNQRGDYNG